MAIALTAAAFVSADYFGAFGLKKYLVLDFAEASFKPVDKETGAPVPDVVITCYQRGNLNACTQPRKNSREMGLVTVRIPMQKLVWESILFKAKEETLTPDNPELRMMFIHPNYTNALESFTVQELYGNTVTKYRVEMLKNF